MMITQVMTLESVLFLYPISWPPNYQFVLTNRPNKTHRQQNIALIPFLSGNIRTGVLDGGSKTK